SLLNSCAVIYATPDQFDKFAYILEHSQKTDAPYWLVLDASVEQVEQVRSRLKIKVAERLGKIGFGGIHVVSAEEYSQKRVHNQYVFAAIMPLAAPKPMMTLEWMKFKAKAYLVEEVTSVHDREFDRIRSLATCRVPYTSFAWEAMKALEDIVKARVA